MPQMAPLYWLSLFCFFIFTLLMFLIVNHFLSPFKKINILSQKSTNPFKPWSL
uniref:ATP synthase F0 subunit 8 n=1 Tax=Pinnaxodes major TaxID=2921218 RepID=UPI0020280F3F|nr:ATP synthase F0 subunit 8 [Pinnaxodes major]UPL65041.1 ATP synthase F0 subunit 8 [Pinnaxodes major]